MSKRMKELGTEFGKDFPPELRQWLGQLSDDDCNREWEIARRNLDHIKSYCPEREFVDAE